MWLTDSDEASTETGRVVQTKEIKSIRLHILHLASVGRARTAKNPMQSSRNKINHDGFRIRASSRRFREKQISKEKIHGKSEDSMAIIWLLDISETIARAQHRMRTSSHGDQYGSSAIHKSSQIASLCNVENADDYRIVRDSERYLWLHSETRLVLDDGYRVRCKYPSQRAWLGE